MNEQSVKLDRMRYTKNTTSSRLALIAIVFNVFYFVSIYKTNVDFYYNLLMGASILYNLVFMLAAFLSSEGFVEAVHSLLHILKQEGVVQICKLRAEELACFLHTASASSYQDASKDRAYLQLLCHFPCKLQLCIGRRIIVPLVVHRE